MASEKNDGINDDSCGGIVSGFNAGTIYRALQWAVLVLAFSVVTYKLIVFDDYDVLLQWFNDISLRQCIGVAVVVLLFPLNYLFESLKWRVSVSTIAQVSLRQAIISTFVGNIGAVITPNRLGDYPARAAWLGLKNVVNATLLGMIGSVMLTIVIVSFGLFALLWYLSYFEFFVVDSHYIYAVAFFLILVVAFLAFFPFILKRVDINKIRNKYVYALFFELSKLTYGNLLLLVLFSFLRYVVFTFQYSIILSVFCGEISFLCALVVVPVIYLFVVVTPTISVSEAVTRAGYALLLFNPFNVASPSVVLATLILWIVNNGVPMCVGLLLYYFKIVKL